MRPVPRRVSVRPPREQSERAFSVTCDARDRLLFTLLASHTVLAERPEKWRFALDSFLPVLYNRAHVGCARETRGCSPLEGPLARVRRSDEQTGAHREGRQGYWARPRAAAALAIDSVIDGITRALKKGDSVTFVGFGTFKTSNRKARTARNPQTGEAIKIPKRKAVRFVAGKALKTAVN